MLGLYWWQNDFLSVTHYNAYKYVWYRVFNGKKLCNGLFWMIIEKIQHFTIRKNSWFFVFWHATLIYSSCSHTLRLINFVGFHNSAENVKCVISVGSQIIFKLMHQYQTQTKIIHCSFFFIIQVMEILLQFSREKSLKTIPSVLHMPTSIYDSALFYRNNY